MDYTYLDKLALQPEKWEELSKNELQVMTFRTCMLYGESRNKNIIPVLFQMYEYLVQHTSVDERSKMLAALGGNIRKNKSKAIMGLFPFIQVEEEGEIIRSAAHFFVNLSVLSNKEFHSGAKILIELIKDATEERRTAFIILGLMDIGNEKIKQMLALVANSLGTEVKSILHNNDIDL